MLLVEKSAHLGILRSKSKEKTVLYKDKDVIGSSPFTP
jgi:hypothetical protein